MVTWLSLHVMEDGGEGWRNISVIHFISSHSMCYFYNNSKVKTEFILGKLNILWNMALTCLALDL